MQGIRRFRCAVVLVALLGVSTGCINPSAIVASRRQSNDALIEEQMAHHIGVLAYLYGYPMVDMHTQMHNETHRTGDRQPVYAPVNRFYRFPHLATPEHPGNFRAPNNDTLYYTGWYDIREEPLVVRTPDTSGRYFTIAITNLYTEVIHFGRRTHGTDEHYFGLVSPGWDGTLPAGVERIEVETPRGWLLGRMLVDGPEDFLAAKALVDEVWAASLSEFTRGRRPALPAVQVATESDPRDSLEFFAVLNELLKEVPPRADELALMHQFDEIGVGRGADFSVDALSESQRKGLERAVADGRKTLKAAMQRTLPDVNGWMTSREIGRYPGHGYMHRASVAKGGYGNLPEESLYPAAIFDAEGALLSGGNAYRLRFAADQMPPVDGFWSLSAYDLRTFNLAPNEIERYSIGDRTRGLVFGEDGSLTLSLQHDRPEDPNANWLPIPRGIFVAVLRFYEPNAAALDGSYELPPLEIVD